jgi:hypothetical protein
MRIEACPTLLLIVAIVTAYEASATAFITSLRSSNLVSKISSDQLQMALTPVGPFCPFRSETAIDVEPRMEKLNSAGPEFAAEMTRLNLDMQMGQTPEPQRLLKVADGIDDAVEQWENLITRLSISPDFQTKEYAKLTQAHLDTHGVTVQSIGSMMRWQGACMRAMAKNTPPPMPPSDLDLAKLMQQANDSREKPSITAMAAAESITSSPFSGDEEAFQSPTVKDEYEKLCRDHMSLIQFGGKYAEFDPLGKIRYLDEIEKIEDRWEVFFARFKLMGFLNKSYVTQCNDFLASMGLDEEQYRKLLKKCHNMMRSDAEADRNRMGI